MQNLVKKLFAILHPQTIFGRLRQFHFRPTAAVKEERNIPAGSAANQGPETRNMERKVWIQASMCGLALVLLIAFPWIDGRPIKGSAAEKFALSQLNEKTLDQRARLRQRTKVVERITHDVAANRITFDEGVEQYHALLCETPSTLRAICFTYLTDDPWEACRKALRVRIQRMPS